MLWLCKWMLRSPIFSLVDRIADSRPSVMCYAQRHDLMIWMQWVEGCFRLDDTTLARASRTIPNARAVNIRYKLWTMRRQYHMAITILQANYHQNRNNTFRFFFFKFFPIFIFNLTIFRVSKHFSNASVSKSQANIYFSAMPLWLLDSNSTRQRQHIHSQKIFTSVARLWRAWLVQSICCAYTFAH